MRLGVASVLLLSALFGSPAAARGDDPPRLLLPPVAVRAAPPSRPADDLPPPSDRIRPVRADDPELPAPKPRAAGLGRPEGARTIPASLVEDRRDERRSGDRGRDRDGIDDFLDRPSDTYRRDRDRDRSSGKVGESWKGLFKSDPDGKSRFCGDTGFDQFASPITSPFLTVDPRSLTELRTVFLYQKVPDKQPDYKGGHLYFFGATGSVAFGERFSLTVNKLGGVGFYPGGDSSYDSGVGFAELWLGPKVTFYRNPECGSILAGGAVFQIPIGSANQFQHTGSLSIAPYVSGGQTLLRSRYGSFNALGTCGYAISTDNQRSDYFYLNAHLDYDIFNGHRFYPVMELNWMQYTTNGTSVPIGAEGRDLANIGGMAKGLGLLTGALGGRFKASERVQFGGALEAPLAGNRGFYQYRVTLDFILRY